MGFGKWNCRVEPLRNSQEYVKTATKYRLQPLRIGQGEVDIACPIWYM